MPKNLINYNQPHRIFLGWSFLQVESNKPANQGLVIIKTNYIQAFNVISQVELQYTSPT